MDARKGYLMVFAASLLWGCIGVFVKSLSALGVTPVSMASSRLLTGAILLLPALVLMGSQENRPLVVLLKVSPGTLSVCAGMGIIGLAASNLCYYECMERVGMSTASVLLYTSPVFGCILGKVLFSESLTRAKLVALALNLAGCALTATEGSLATLSLSGIGVMWGLAAGFLGAVFAVFSKFAAGHGHPLTITFYVLLLGGLAMGALSFPWADVKAAASSTLALAILGFGLLPTALAYIIYMEGLSFGLEASKVPVVASFETVSTVLVGSLLYHEPMNLPKFVGISLVMLSILAMSFDLERLSQSTVLAEWREANSFSPSIWKAQKQKTLTGLLTSSDWQAWIALR